MSYEYLVVPAPTRGVKAKGVKSAEDRFAVALETVMNKMASDGWDYYRADTLPSEQREGLMGKTTVYQNMLVFRRAKEALQLSVPAPSVTPPTPAPKIAAKDDGDTKKVTPPAPTPSPDLAAE